MQITKDMKKIFNLLLAVATAVSVTTSCSDIPAPYNLAEQGSSLGKKLPYKSAALNTGWSTHAITPYNPWSQGSSYTQATGYQKWDGSDTKTNKAVEGYLISPAINTTCASGKVSVTFDHVIGYANNDPQYAEHIAFYVSKNYDGKDFAAATWEKIPFTIAPEAVNTKWTLVNVGNIQLPEAYVNQDGVYFAFYMKSGSAEKSATWEVTNFYVQEGEGTVVEPTPPTSGEQKLPYSESFSSALGGFTNQTVSGKGTWTIDFSTAKATGYNSADKTTTAGRFLLISPTIDLGTAKEAHVSYEYILRYNKGDQNQVLYILKDADYKEGGENQWVELNKKHTEGTDWKTFSAADIDIPAEYLGQKIRLAFAYESDNKSGSTWEVRNFSIQEGKAGSIASGEEKPNEEVTGNEFVQLKGNTATLINVGTTAEATGVTFDIDAAAKAMNIATGTSVEGQTFTLDEANGTTMTVSKGQSLTAPVYHEKTKGLRLYASNTLQFKSNKVIAKIVAECDFYNNINQVGNPTATFVAEPVSTGSSLLYTNFFNDTHKGGVQMRPQKLTIYYAK